MKAVKGLIIPFEVAQKSIKIKIKLIFSLIPGSNGKSSMGYLETLLFGEVLLNIDNSMVRNIDNCNWLHCTVSTKWLEQLRIFDYAPVTKIIFFDSTCRITGTKDLLVFGPVSVCSGLLLQSVCSGLLLRVSNNSNDPIIWKPMNWFTEQIHFMRKIALKVSKTTYLLFKFLKKTVMKFLVCKVEDQDFAT